MKRFIVLGLCLLVVACTSGCITSDTGTGNGDADTGSQNDLGNHVSDMDKVVLASGEWAPYTSENLLYEGVVSRIVTDAFALEGVEVEYAYLPWARSMEAAKNGEYHGTLPWLKNDEREADFYFSEPIAAQTVVLFYKQDINFTWETFSDLIGYRIGGTTSYTYGDVFDAAIEDYNLSVELATDDTMNFRKLMADRLDIVICEIDVGYDIMKQVLTSIEYGQITNHPMPINYAEPSEPLYLLLSKVVEGNDELIEKFDRGLKRLEESGKVGIYWDESRLGEYRKTGQRL